MFRKTIILLGILIIFLCIVVGASAVSSGTCGENLTWTLDDNGLLTISGTGEMEDYAWNRGAPWGNSRVKAVMIGEGVTRISERAFSTAANLTTIILPESLTDIGPYAFYKCSGLKEITFPAGLVNIGEEAFYLAGLESVSIPNNMKKIGDYAFNSSRYLKSVTIPEGVMTIGAGAFQKTILENVTIPESVTSIKPQAFASCEKLKCISIPDGVSSIGSSAFRDCYKLESVTIPKNVTVIENNIFENCLSLTGIMIPSGVTCIGDHAFSGASLTDISIPASVKTIEECAFWQCKKLENVTIPDGVEVIKQLAFYGCDNLKSVKLPESLSIIGSKAFPETTKLIVPDGSFAYRYAAYTSGSPYEVYFVERSVTMTTDGNGTAVATPSAAANGWNVLLTATSNEGYKFKAWEVLSGDVAITDDRFIMGSQDVEIKAIFEPAIDISSANVSSVKDQIYTGKKTTPGVTVKYNEKMLAEGKDYTLSFRNNKKIGVATILISGMGDYTGETTKTFNIIPETVNITGLKPGKNTLTVKWKKSSSVTGYEIQYGTDKKFRKAETTTVEKGKTTSAAIKDLKSKKTYYVRIRSYKTVNGTIYYSNWSKTMKEKVK